MERVFGIPAGGLAVGLVVIMAVVFGLLALLAVRNRVFFRLGTRNVVRRRSRSVLIVAGLMLATAIIASSLATGDTMGRTIRAEVLESLGRTDVVVGAEGAQLDATLALDSTSRDAYFDAGRFDDVRDALLGSDLVDGVAPAVVDTVAVQNLTARRTEPRVGLFGSDPDHLDGFDSIRADGTEVSLADLGPDEVYLDTDAADDLEATAGDELLVFGRADPVELRVRAVVEFAGAGTPDAAMLAALPVAQDVVGEPGLINQVLVSNRGDEVTGAALTDEVVALLEPALAGLGLEARAVKQDGLDLADEQGNAFMALFSTFGSFSIAAGILLIFLIFVMLAAERRTEMGIARAVGTQRRHLVQTFLFEGAVYDVLAAAVGALLGVGISYVMVQAVASAFATDGLDVTFDVRAQSVVIAYGLGVVLTLAVIAVSAWRVSVLDIVTAIRDLPSPPRVRGRRRWLLGAGAVVVGALLTAAGASGGQATPFLLGVSIVIAGLVPIARALGVPERPAYTVGGLAIIVWWLLPTPVVEAVVGDLSFDFSVWVVSGLMVVLGTTWTVMYNADVVLAGVTRLTARVRSLTPVVRMAVAYPLRSRLRTSMTLAMFTLVVFTLVAGTTISGSFINSFDDIDRFGGGWDVRAVAAPVRPIDDVRAALADAPGIDLDDIEAIGAQSMVPVEARQVGTETWADYPVRGLDDEFLAETTYDLAALATGYERPEDVWAAMRDERGLAVVDAFVAPRRSEFNFGATPEFALSGFYLEDEVFDPVEVEVHDPVSDSDLTVTVVGVLSDDAPWEMAGITVSQDTLEPLGDRAAPSTFWFRLADGVDADATAGALESALLDNGVEASTLQERLDEAVSASWTVNRLIQGFIGLGLVVGVVALGVVSARAVVERRQQIGVLRAVGFQPGMVRLSFLIEASFVSLTAIVAGTGLGLALSRNVVADVGEQQGVALTIPWVDLGVVFVVVYLAALASTLAPALRASRVYPAEALRYQ